MQKKKKHSPANMILGVIGGLAYIALLFLFAWQTWQFVSWLFPDDQLLMKLLTLISFDVCALLFGCIHLFYHFAHRAAKTWIFVAWIFTNILSALASIFFLVIESIFRFHLPINQTTVDIGYAISILALIFDGLILTLWVYLEWEARHPRQDEFADEEQDEEPPARQPEKQAVHAHAQQERMFTESEVRAMFTESQKQSSPLHQPQVETSQASHEGNQNGKQ